MSPVAADLRLEIEQRLRAAGCVFAEEETALLLAATADPGRLAELVGARVAGSPLEQLLGWVRFCDLTLPAGLGVFVPRRRTELLVREAGALLGPGDAVLDLCCGTGAVAAALLSRVPTLTVHAVDIDCRAVDLAQRSLPGATVHLGDLYAPLPPALRGGFRGITANAPYVPTGQIPLLPSEARDHEPTVALDGGQDGLDVGRRVIAEAADWLVPDGYLLIETSYVQSDLTADLVRAAGLTPTVIHDDNLDATVVIGAAAVALG